MIFHSSKSNDFGNQTCDLRCVMWMDRAQTSTAPHSTGALTRWSLLLSFQCRPTKPRRQQLSWPVPKKRRKREQERGPMNDRSNAEGRSQRCRSFDVGVTSTNKYGLMVLKSTGVLRDRENKHVHPNIFFIGSSCSF